MSDRTRRWGVAGLYAVPDSPTVAAPSCSCAREVVSAPNGRVVVVRVTGEIDRSSEASLRAELDHAWPRRPAHLVVDLSGVTFCDCAGFALLADAAVRAVVGRIGFSVTGLSSQLQRHSGLIWASDLPVRHRSVAHAVMAFRASQPACVGQVADSGQTPEGDRPARCRQHRSGA
ncbi:STAS domain-containing protein [Pseudonocardia sp. Cha107L01]|uniref:STAS domain-containing protein n=1 Tax=Pseudonocardia sp. Cha107L01 TaxID=3457576 RepID=UPI00403EB8B8